MLKGLSEASAEALVCANCEDAEAALYCAKCEDLLCAACAESTHASKALKKHQMVAASECAAAAAKQPVLCPEHDEPFKYICLDCNVVACVDCKEFGAHQVPLHYTRSAPHERSASNTRSAPHRSTLLHRIATRTRCAILHRLARGTHHILVGYYRDHVVCTDKYSVVHDCRHINTT